MNRRLTCENLAGRLGPTVSGVGPAPLHRAELGDRQFIWDRRRVLIRDVQR